MNSTRTAAALVIGNELLTGKVQDVNVAALAQELFGIGVRLQRVVFCPDEIETIGRDLNDLRSRFELVFTSGGVGPTHDDVTMSAVAQALDRPLVTSQAILDLLQTFFGDRLSEPHRRMALVPEGTELVTSPRHRWPAVRVENVFILPGLPEIFQRKLPLLREHLDTGVTFVSRSVRTGSDEGALAPLLERLDSEFPEVSIGSYPRWGEGPVRVVVTFDGISTETVERAAEALRTALPKDLLVEEEGS